MVQVERHDVVHRRLSPRSSAGWKSEGSSLDERGKQELMRADVDVEFSVFERISKTHVSARKLH